MKILIVGLSKMSKAFLSNLPQNFTGEIHVFSPNSKSESFTSYNSFDELNSVYDYIFLGCKPQNLNEIASLPKKNYTQNTVFISILAGVSIEKIRKIFPVENIFRAMPSLAFEYGKSIIAVFSGGNHKENVLKMFTPNEVISCKSEEEIDEFTAIYGSGIGFVFEVMNSFYEASQKFLPNEEKRNIILNLFQNAVLYMKENPDVSFAKAVQNVASKGGTTEAGLKEIKAGNLQEVIQNAMNSAFKRAKELR